MRPGETALSKTAAYRLTLLKKLSQSTKPSTIKESVADLPLVQGLYRDLQPVLEALDLPPEGIRYYAQSVLKSEIFQVTRRADADRYLHLIAFIVHQYYRLQDTLVDILLHAVQTYVNTVRRIHKDPCYERRARRTQDIKALVSYLEAPSSVCGPRSRLSRRAHNGTILRRSPTFGRCSRNRNPYARKPKHVWPR
jgi:hypothetical protein